MGALNESFVRRSRRVRHTLKRAANGRVRLSVFRSSRHIYAQVIDDQAGKTVAAASTLDKDLKGALPKGSDMAAAQAVGKLVAERALEGRGQRGRVRPRRLSLSWARQGARRGCPRSGLNF